MRKNPKAFPRSQELALILISAVVRDACDGSQKPSARKLKKLAKASGKALAAGLKKFNESI